MLFLIWPGRTFASGASHARLGLPCQVTAYLFAVQVVAARNRYFAAVAAFFDGGHRLNKFNIVCDIDRDRRKIIIFVIDQDFIENFDINLISNFSSCREA